MNLIDDITFKVRATCLIGWCVCSLGTPFIACAYVGWLGTNYGHTMKYDTKFKQNVRDSPHYPITMVYGPFAIIHSIYFAVSTTYYLLANK